MKEHPGSGPIDMVIHVFSRIMMWAPFFIVLIILYEIVKRYFFAAATLWVNEMSLWVAGGIYLSAGLYALLQRSHIRIFIIYDMVPLWLKRVFDILSTLCVIIFAFALIWGGFGEAIAKFWRWETFGTAFDPPIPATNKPLILAVMFFLALQSLSNLVRDWPAIPWVRKLFDISASIVIIGLAMLAAYNLYIIPPEGSVVPLKWQIAIGIFLAGAVVLVIYGLIRDFNTTPQPAGEFDEIEEEAEIMKQQAGAVPDEILSGNPPKTKP